MSHLDEGTIHAWLDGALAPDEAARVEAHARDCADCSAMVAEARGFIAGASRIVSSLDIVRGDVIPPPVAAPVKPASRGSIWRALKFTPARAAIAATLLVAVASMFTLRHQDIELASPSVSRPADSALAASAPSSVRADTFAVNQPGAERVAPKPARGEAVPSDQRGAVQSKAADVPKSRVPTATSSAADNVMAPAAPAPARAERRIPVGATVQATVPSAVAVPTPLNAPPAAEPAPVPARRAFRDSTARLMEVVTTGAATRDVASKVARSGAGAAARSPVEARVPGCYRLQVDPPVDLRGFPTQFRLAYDSTTGSHPVYSINVDRDSILNGAGWQVNQPATVVVTGTDARFGSVQVSFAADSARALVRSMGGTGPATIQRTPCTR